jgi:hypothetical protein
VVKSPGSRWSETVGIPHQSSANGQIDPVEDDCVDLGQTEMNGDVREVRQDVGSVGVGARGSGVIGVRRNRRFTVPVRRRSSAKILWHGGDFWERKEGKRRRRAGDIRALSSGNWGP